MNTDPDIKSKLLMIGQLVRQSSRKGRKLIALEIAVTVNTYQIINSHLLKIVQLVRQFSRSEES